MIEDDNLKKDANWDKVSADIKNESDNEPVCNKELLKTKIKSHEDEVANSYDKKFIR